MDTSNATPTNETPAPTSAEHASKLHRVLSGIESVASLLDDPAVVALLPAKYRGYAMAIGAVNHVLSAH